MNNEKIKDYIITEFRRLHGELILQRTIFDTRQSINPDEMNDITDFFEYISKEKKEHDDLMKLTEYNRGKCDAYIEVLNLLGYENEK